MKIYVGTVYIAYKDKDNRTLHADYSHAFTNKLDAQLWESDQQVRKDTENMLKQALKNMYLEDDKFWYIRATQIQEMDLD